MPDDDRAVTINFGPVTIGEPAPRRPSLEIVLTQACKFALGHGVEPPISPDDFGIQRSSAGWQHATYVTACHAVTVTIDPDGVATFGVAELDWIHPDFGPPDAEDCGICYPDPESDHYRGIPLTDVYLPGDAPGPQHAEVVDGVLVHGEQPLDDQAREALAVVINAARNKLAEEANA